MLHRGTPSAQGGEADCRAARWRLARSLALVGLLLVGFLGLCACGASGVRSRALAYAGQGAPHKALALYEQTSPPDAQLLVDIAAALLQRDALATDAAVRADAFAQLAFAGHRARQVLQALSAQSQAVATRAAALSVLARLGDHSARDTLRELVLAADPEVADLAFAQLDPQLERARLLSALSSPRAQRRLAALSALWASSTADDLRLALIELARRDPIAQLRGAAVFALRGQGALAADAVAEALDDVDESVRVAAMITLPSIDAARATSLLSRYLGTAPSAQSVEAARALLLAGALSESARARAALAQALSAPDFKLRARAAVTYRGLPAALRDPAALHERLSQEGVAEVRFALALTLGVSDAPARKAMTQLAAGDGALAVQAAGELAAAGDASARAKLAAWPGLAKAPASLRTSLARALAALGMSRDARCWLLDPDAAVRRAAAGAILAGAIGAGR